MVWYVLQIEIKLKRALHGFYTDKDDYLPGDYQTDFNGSAKIAVIGINSSLQAFEKLLQKNNPLLKIKWDYWNRFAQKPMSNSPTWMHLNDRVLMSSNDITISEIMPVSVHSKRRLIPVFRIISKYYYE